MIQRPEEAACSADMPMGVWEIRGGLQPASCAFLLQFMWERLVQASCWGLRVDQLRSSDVYNGGLK
jgi:hypothetical protein